MKDLEVVLEWRSYGSIIGVQILVPVPLKFSPFLEIVPWTNYHLYHQQQDPDSAAAVRISGSGPAATVRRFCRPGFSPWTNPASQHGLPGP